jgi:ATP-dependent DNA helicase RecG
VVNTPRIRIVLDEGTADWDDPEDLRALMHRRRALPRENEWVEFKVDNATNPDEIGQYVFCLANSAALAGQETGFMVWGIDDVNHAVVGTKFQPIRAKRGNEDVYPWVLHLLDSQVDFSFHELDIDGTPVVAMRVDAATKLPVKFHNIEYIRWGPIRSRCTSIPIISSACGRF